MRARRNIIHILLVLAILTAGFPVYHHTDVNRDERTDLADAILSVRELAQTSVNAQSFKEELKEAVATLKVVSGFAKVIKSPRSASLIQHDESPYGIESFVYPHTVSFVHKIPQEKFSYQTQTILPLVPPPKA